MEGGLAVPFHFAVEFLVLVVAIGAAFDAVRARKHGAGSWALGQAAGFLLLAAGQAAHGALIFPLDAEPVVLGLRTGAFALLLVSARPAFAPQASILAAGMPAVLYLPGPAARMAFAPALLALVVAARGIAAHRRDQQPTTFAFAAAFVCLALAEGAVAASPPEGGVLVTVAHASRALAALFLARWLWSSIVRSVRMRFVAAFAAVLTIGVLLVSAALSVVIGNTLQREELKRLTAAGEARIVTMDELADAAVRSAALFSRAESFREALVSGDDLSTQALAAAALTPGDFIVFLDGNRRVLGSAENIPTEQGEVARALPAAQEIAIAGRRVVGEALAGRPAASIEQVAFVRGDGTPADEALVLGASPSEESARVVGVVLVGYRIDARYLARVREDTGAEATLLISDRIAASTLADQAVVQRAFAPLSRRLRLARETGEQVRATVSMRGTEYMTAIVPLESADHQVVGLLALSVNSQVVANAQRDITRTVFLITLLAVAFAALLAWLSGGRVTKPIRSLTAAARELSAGNYGARTRVTSSDEVGALGAAFNDMATQLERQTGALRDAASTEATLRSRMEAVLQSMADGLIATDEAGVIVMFNRAASAMLRRKPEDAVGRSLSEVLAGRTTAGKSLAHAALEGRSAEGRLERDRGTLPIAMTSAPLLESRGDAVGRVVLLRDVSREAEAERMKSEFLSNVSHELRTPITPIRGYAEILSRKKFTREKTEQFLEGILESTERLERIVEILVDFSSIEAGRLKPRSDAVELRGLLDQMTQRWKERTRAHRFVRRSSTDLPAVLGDAKLIGRSVNELIDNAVKFSPNGGTIEVIADAPRNGTRRPSKVVITVKDHGIGIEPEKIPELFRDFRQGDGSDTRAYGGLGLGLAYVKRIADIHGGDVTVTSTPGKGSAFSLVLPVASASAKPRVASPPARTATRRTPAKPVAAARSAARRAGRAVRKPSPRRARAGRAKGGRR